MAAQRHGGAPAGEVQLAQAGHLGPQPYGLKRILRQTTQIEAVVVVHAANGDITVPINGKPVHQIAARQQAVMVVQIRIDIHPFGEICIRLTAISSAPGNRRATSFLTDRAVSASRQATAV